MKGIEKLLAKRNCTKSELVEMLNESITDLSVLALRGAATYTDTEVCEFAASHIELLLDIKNAISE